MRKLLDTVYAGAGWLGAIFLIGTLTMVLAGVLGRLMGFHLRGSDAYAGYCMAAASFLALAATLKRGEHIRVTLILHHVGARAGRALDVGCHFVALTLSGVLAWYSVRLAWQSHTFNDISQGNDATPLWIPQLSMAIGTIVLFIAFLDDFLILISGARAGQPDSRTESVRPE